MLCGAQGSRGAVGAADVFVLTPVGWRGDLCAWGWAWGDVPQAPSLSSRLLEGLPQASEDIRVVLGGREVAGVDSFGMERIGQHGFSCGLWHPAPRRLEAAVLCRPLAGPVDQAPDGRLCPGPRSQLPELRVGPALPPLAPGQGRGLAWRCERGCVWWGHGDWWRWRALGSPRSPVPWVCLGSGVVRVRGPVGTRARSLLRGWAAFRDGGGSGASAGCGPTFGVGKGAGTLLVGPGAALVRSGVVRWPGVRALRGGRTRCVAPRPRRAPP